MALWIIGGILLLLILLLLLRVGVHLRFGEQLELTVIAGPARIQLLPGRKDGDRAKDQAEEKSQERSTGEEACQAAGKALSELRGCPLGAAVPVGGPEAGAGSDPAADADRPPASVRGLCRGGPCCRGADLWLGQQRHVDADAPAGAAAKIRTRTSIWERISVQPAPK